MGTSKTNISTSNKNRDEYVKLLAPDAIILEFHGCNLGDVHAYSDVAYIRFEDATDSESDNNTNRNIGSCYCHLCKSLIFEGTFRREPHQVKMLEMHVRSDKHEVRYSQLVFAQKKLDQRTRQERLTERTFLQERAKCLELPRWRWHMSDLIMEYIDEPCGACERWDKTVLQLAKYEQMERLTLLELAILKYNLCTCDENGSCRHHRRQEEGSKKRRRVDEVVSSGGNIMLMDQTAKSGAEIIIPLVREFLGDPQLEETYSE